MNGFSKRFSPARSAKQFGPSNDTTLVKLPGIHYLDTGVAQNNLQSN